MHIAYLNIINHISSSFILIHMLSMCFFICFENFVTNFGGRVQAHGYLGVRLGGGERSDVPACVFSLWEHPPYLLQPIILTISNTFLPPVHGRLKSAGVVCPEK